MSKYKVAGILSYFALLVIIMFNPVIFVHPEADVEDRIVLISLATGRVVYRYYDHEKQPGKDIYGYGIMGSVRDENESYGQAFHKLDDKLIEIHLDRYKLETWRKPLYIHTEAGLRVIRTPEKLALYDCSTRTLCPLDENAEMEIRGYRISIVQERLAIEITISYE